MIFYLFSSSSFLSSSSSFCGNVGTQTAREIRLALCGPDICSRRQAYCIPHIGAAREGGGGGRRGRSPTKWGLLGRKRKEQENRFHMNLWFLFLGAVYTRISLFLLISFFLLCPSFFFFFPHFLSHLCPSFTSLYCGNGVFICCLQRVALSLEDDGYP